MLLSRLEDLIKTTELSKQEFAEKIGLSKQKLYKIEKKIRNLQVEDMINLSKVYNINLNWLLLGIGEKKNKIVADSEIQDLIDYLALESQTETGYELLIKSTLGNIINKLSSKQGFFKMENNRPTFLLMKILKNFNFEDKLDNKGYIENIIIEDTNEKKDTKEKLLFQLKKLKDEEVDFLVKYRSTSLEILEGKYDFLTKIIFMNKLTN